MTTDFWQVRWLQTCSLFAVLLALTACSNDDSAPGERIREFTSQMQQQDGFLPLYLDAGKGKAYLLTDGSEGEFLYQESLPRGVGSNDLGLDRGQLGDRTALVRFESAGDKVLLKKLNLRYRADSDQAAERSAVEQAFASSVLWGFPIAARDGERKLLDVTEFLLRDSHGIGRRLKALKEGEYKVDSSRSAVFIERSKAFPHNTELEAIVTLAGSNPGQEVRSVVPDPFSITVHMHHSFIELPDEGYQPRQFHPRSGFWATAYVDYAAPLAESMQRRFIPRHRLEKKEPEADLSEAVEPLVYYLDPGIPEPVKSALQEGALWWNQAFEAAGFRDAFQVEVLPEDADPMDVRYNVIQWVHRSTRGWSYGSSVVDPRTGEILKGHVTLGSLRVRQDLLIARGMTSPFEEDGDGAGDVQAQEMAIARIRQLSAHEVGHTLGLAHNFAASARSRASVMDYPYMDLRLADDGNVSLSDAYATGIGDWDKRSILYGYAQFDDDAEIDSLDAIIRENGELGFEFISDPDSRSIRDFHPRSHLWDNGADAVEQLELTMRLRAAALNKFGARAIPETAPYSDLQEAIVPVYLFHRYQVEAAGKLLGGADYSYALRTDDIDQPVTPVPADRQRDALYALLDTLDVTALALPDELIAQIPPKAYGYRRTRESAPSRTGALFDPVTLAEVAIEQTLSVLLHPERLARLQLQSALDPRQVSASEVMENLHTRVLRVEYEVLPGAIARRAGSAILRHWRALLVADDVAPEVQAASRAALLRAQRLFESQRGSREPYRSYYQHEAWLIERLFENPATGTRSKPAPIPPGSPVGSDH